MATCLLVEAFLTQRISLKRVVHMSMTVKAPPFLAFLLSGFLSDPNLEMVPKNTELGILRRSIQSLKNCTVLLDDLEFPSKHCTPIFSILYVHDNKDYYQ
jgi:hypothetical protein